MKPTSLRVIPHLRNLTGEGTEGFGEGQHLGQHGCAHTEHRHGTEGKGGRDDADDRTHEDRQQMPGYAI